MTKPMNAREYRENAARIKAQTPGEIVTLASGSVFELRRPDLQGFVMTGRVPQSLLAEGMAAWKESGIVPATAKSPAKLGNEEVINSLIFMREIVHECCVNPKFVEFATADDEIGANEMLPDDFTEIFQWAMSHQGVAGLDGLKSFRDGSGTAPGARTRRKKQRVQSEQPVGA